MHDNEHFSKAIKDFIVMTMKTNNCWLPDYIHTYIQHTTILWPSWILSRTARVSQHQKGKTNLDLLEQEIVSGNGISWAICKSAP